MTLANLNEFQLEFNRFLEFSMSSMNPTKRTPMRVLLQNVITWYKYAQCSLRGVPWIPHIEWLESKRSIACQMTPLSFASFLRMIKNVHKTKRWNMSDTTPRDGPSAKPSISWRPPDPSTVFFNFWYFPACFQLYIAKIYRDCWKEHLEISNMAKQESLGPSLRVISCKIAKTWFYKAWKLYRFVCPKNFATLRFYKRLI